jgi:hypothetical protein
MRTATLSDLVTTANTVVKHALDKYIPTLTSSDGELLIELAYAPCTTLTHKLVLSKREEQLAAAPQINQMLIWISRAGILDLSSRLEITPREAIACIDLYAGFETQKQQQGVWDKIEYGYFFMSLLNSDVIRLLNPVKNIPAVTK